MGKNHRHKKNQKAEKAKVHLKNSKTKFLPKGQNETKINFKIKPIVIREQFQEHRGEHVTSKNLNLKDILNRLKHHNVTVRVDNCQQMREYITTIDSAELGMHVGDILQAICPLFVDIETIVRKTSLKVLNDLLGRRSSENMSPFFEKLTSYLCCCMTHINENAQEDSLLILDSLLLHVPELLANRCDRILQNFMLLISKVKTKASDRSVLQSKVRSKRTSVQWRLHVLTRLKRLLKIVLEKKIENEVEMVEKFEIIDITKVNCAPIYYDKYLNCVDIFAKDTNPSLWLEKCIDDVMPLLKDILVEVMPEQLSFVKSGDLSSTMMDDDGINTLNCVLNIFMYLYELVCLTHKDAASATRAKISTTLCQDILLLALKNFPYVKKSSGRKNSVLSETADKCLEENFLICYLFFAIFRRQYDKDHVNHILLYLNFCLSSRNYVGHEQSPMLLKILKQIYGENINYYNPKFVAVEDFVNKTAHYYLQDTKQANNGIDIFLMLCDHLDKIDEFPALAEKSCRVLLGKTMDPVVLKFISLLAKKNMAAVHNALGSMLENILSNIHEIKIDGIEIEHLKIVQILSLFYYIPLSEQNIQSLKKFATSNVSYANFIKCVTEKKYH